MATGKNSSNTLLMLVILIIVAAGAYYFFNGRDTRTGSEKIGDAVDSLTKTHSLDSAGDQLKDFSPAEKLGNSIRDKAKQPEK